MKILVTGAGGQLGQCVTSLLSRQTTHEFFALTKSELDITDEAMVASTVQSIQPDAVLHCAAYTNVEAAEDEGNELNWKINREGSMYISKATAAIDAKLVFISTDYVFDGSKLVPYETTDATKPLNQYGAAKLAGETAVQQYHPSAHIIRTSWVFAENGHNFVNTMLRLAPKMSILKVVNDQFGRPTYAPDLAAFMVYILERDASSGIYHFSNDGQATWYEFAKQILKERDVDILPVNSTEFVQKAIRPKHSVMSLKSSKATGFRIPTWENALERFMQSL